jgi:hypothetical protein
MVRQLQREYYSYQHFQNCILKVSRAWRPENQQVRLAIRRCNSLVLITEQNGLEGNDCLACGLSEALSTDDSSAQALFQQVLCIIEKRYLHSKRCTPKPVREQRGDISKIQRGN